MQPPVQLPPAVLTELAKITRSRDLAESLLMLTRLPTDRWPNYDQFDDARSFWFRVDQLFAAGVVERGAVRFLEALAADYPGNDVFLAALPPAARPTGPAAPGVRLTLRRRFDLRRFEALVELICGELAPGLTVRVQAHGLGGVTALLTTQDTDVARRVAERVAAALGLAPEELDCQPDAIGGMYASLTFSLPNGVSVTVSNVPMSEGSTALAPLLDCLCGCGRG